jgi:hypothetical protein
MFGLWYGQGVGFFEDVFRVSKVAEKDVIG